MKAIDLKLFALSIFISFYSILYSQSTLSEEDKKSIQRSSKWILHKHAKFPSTLAAKLTKNLENEESKVYALIYWLAKNIKYDYSAYLSNTLSRHSSNEVLKRRKALCSEYVALFNEMCEAVGLKSETINGYVRDFDFFPGDTLYRAEHAWSTVNIDNKWELMDITWGAGYIEPKKQLIKKALWLLFEKPYEVEFHYVHKYNPNWFHVDPSKMVASHLPTFDFFQFLKNPISIKDFQKGRDAVLSKVLMVENGTSPPLKEYLSMGEMQRLALENTISKKNIPENNRLLGFNNYLMFEDLYSKHYNPDERQIFASKKTRGKMNSYSKKAIYNLQKAIENNQQEYSHYESRSLAWLDTLTDVNKSLSKKIRNRVKENSTQTSSLKKINKKTISYQKATNKSANKFKKFNLSSTKRPKSDRDYIALAKALIKFKDSLINKVYVDEKSIDSLFTFYDAKHQNTIALTEKQVKNIHDLNKNEINKFILDKKLDYAFIYFDNEMVNKSWLTNGFERANYINYENLKILLNDLSSFLTILKSKIKLDNRNTYSALKALKLAKKSSFKDLNESNQVKFIIQDYKRRFQKYSEGYRKYFHIKNKVEWWLKFSKKNLKQTNKKLLKDIRLEKQRHKNYMTYRKSIQDSENKNMKLLIKKLEKMGKGFQNEEPILAKKSSYNNKKFTYSKSYSEWSQTSGSENVPSSSLEEEKNFVNLLNKARMKKGMSELKVDEDLCRAARYHSFDMGAQNYFEHATYDRDETTNRLQKVCGTFARINRFGNSYGENIAAGSGSGDGTYNQWFNSPGHYGNIFNPKFKTIGVGYVKTEGSSYTHYWTTDFGY